MSDPFITQLELEGIRLDQQGRMYRWRDMPGETGPAARLAAVDYGDCCAVYFGTGIDAAAERLIRSLPSRLVYADPERIKRVLGPGCGGVGPATYQTYLCDTGADREDDPATRGRLVLVSPHEAAGTRLPGGHRHPGQGTVHAVMIEGVVISFATSSRATDSAAECWVYTDPAYRRCGHARRVVRSWAAEQRSAGRTAFYSHAEDNTASRRLAASLGYRVKLTVTSFP